MRRIPRLRRSSRLSAPASLSPAGQLGLVQSPPATPHSISISYRRPAPTSFQCPTFSRFYSSSSSSDKTQAPSRSVDELSSEELAELGPEHLEDVEFQVEEEHQLYGLPPGPSRAERPDEVSDVNYVSALTADGLESVGGLENWWDKPGNWPRSADFASFRSRRKALNPAVIEAAVRRAVVEAFALKETGREDDLVAAWPVGGQEDLRRLLGMDINAAENGSVSLTGNTGAVVDALSRKGKAVASGETEIEEVASESTVDNTPVLSSEEAQKYKETWGHGWKKVSLSDPRIKFAVTKRVFQLTGQLVPDHQLSSINDVWSLLRVVQKPPKPKTLTQEIQERHENLVQLPNVTVSTKRVTRGDKDKAIGRFKLIEEELRKRDLPLGSLGSIRKNRELSRLKGGL
ncbi:hypothetical protein AAE478_008108 [Parahypoxylon ruwenzoriense]